MSIADVEAFALSFPVTGGARLGIGRAVKRDAVLSSPGNVRRERAISRTWRRHIDELVWTREWSGFPGVT
jgi:hypothetical protein